MIHRARFTPKQLLDGARGMSPVALRMATRAVQNNDPTLALEALNQMLIDQLRREEKEERAHERN